MIPLYGICDFSCSFIECCVTDTRPVSCAPGLMFPETVRIRVPHSEIIQQDRCISPVRSGISNLSLVCYGSSNSKRAPPSVPSITLTVQPCVFAISLTIKSPNPVPSVFVVTPWSNTVSCWSVGIPVPSPRRTHHHRVTGQQ